MKKNLEDSQQEGAGWPQTNKKRKKENKQTEK
jgi:hypothetical protein